MNRSFQTGRRTFSTTAILHQKNRSIIGEVSIAIITAHLSSLLRRAGVFSLLVYAMSIYLVELGCSGAGRG